MKMSWLLFFLLPLFSVQLKAQQIMYANLKDLANNQGDTVTILKVEKRTKNQIYLTGGADFRIEAFGNSGLSRYLRSRCYAVRIDSSLYVNCRKMRYKRYRLGGWYAPAFCIGDKIYYTAQPVGQVAASSSLPADATKLGGDVGNAIAASGLVNVRVFYELDTTTGRSDFVGKEKMLQLLESTLPHLKDSLLKETSESADVIRPYLLALFHCRANH